MSIRLQFVGISSKSPAHEGKVVVLLEIALFVILVVEDSLVLVLTDKLEGEKGVAVGCNSDEFVDKLAIVMQLQLTARVSYNLGTIVVPSY
jgi:hypothetical protein